MKKEEILEKSRKENKNKDMYVSKVESDGAKIGSIAMLVLACIYYCYEIFKGLGSNPAIYSIITIYCTCLYGYKAIKVEKDRKLDIVCAILWGIMTILLILNYFNIL